MVRGFVFQVWNGEQDDMVDFSEFQKFKDKIKATSNEFIYMSLPKAGHFLNGASREGRVKTRKFKKQFLKKQGYTQH
ncbi:hypothetical protein BKI52_15260 [marine bacterium AO1-C]|nr:hypothetical protein BKI52_15260 [marine bacterium AO1-C]